jgi:hypothetical protein
MRLLALLLLPPVLRAREHVAHGTTAVWIVEFDVGEER